MPDGNHTDMPVPEEMNFPDTLRITIASAEDAFDETVAAAGAAEDGEQRDAVVSLEAATGIRKLLTDRRLELLRSLMGQPAESITELTDRLDRSYSAVHEDVEILAEYGIVQYREAGQSKQPFVPYETIEFDVTIRVPPTGDDTEASA
jgi:predicted transcriptional regulator